VIAGKWTTSTVGCFSVMQHEFSATNMCVSQAQDSTASIQEASMGLHKQLNAQAGASICSISSETVAFVIVLRTCFVNFLILVHGNKTYTLIV